MRPVAPGAGVRHAEPAFAMRSHGSPCSAAVRHVEPPSTPAKTGHRAGRARRDGHVWGMAVADRVNFVSESNSLAGAQATREACPRGRWVLGER